MKLRWKMEADGKLTLQYFFPLNWADKNEHWENVPTFEPKETAEIEQAVAAERERCARLVETFISGPIGREAGKVIREGLYIEQR